MKSLHARSTLWLPIVLLFTLVGCRLVAPASPSTTGMATPQATHSPDNRVSPTSAPVASGPNCLQSDDLHPDQEGMGDPYYPSLGNGGYDVRHYLLELDVNPNNHLLKGRAEISALALKTLEAFNLDLTGLDVLEVSVNGETAVHHHTGSELAVIPAAALQEGQAFSVVVEYSGIPKPLDPGVGFLLGWNIYDGGSYVASEPAGASTWYPVNDHPCDKATYTYRVTVPKPLVVAANGVLVEKIDQGKAQTYVWEMDDPMASYLATVNIDDFVEDEQSGPGGLPIRNFYVKEAAEAARVDFERTAEMIQFFSEKFGPYPFDAYGVVVVGQDLNFALETQSLSLFGRRSVDGRGGAEQVAAHELSHQWFGDNLSLETWRDIWLNEGFATYAQWMWLEHSMGREALDHQAREWYNQMLEMVAPPPGDPGTRELFGVSVYYRGALTLHALRLKVGDETFDRILRTYYDQYQGGNAGTDEFIAVAETVSGDDLEEFFNGWLYEKRVPAIPEMNLHPNPES